MRSVSSWMPARLQHARSPRPSPARSSRNRSRRIWSACAALACSGARHQVLRGLELAQQPLHVVGVGRAFLGVARVAVARGAAGEERALGRVRAGIGAVGDAVAVDVEIAAEVACRPRARRRSSPCRGRIAALSSQFSGRHSRWFMPMSRSSITKIGVCSRSARSKACARELEGLGRVLREQQHVLGVAVRGIGAGR